MRLKLRGLSIAVMAFIVGAGVTYGMPHSMVMSSSNPGHTASSKPHRSGEAQENEAPETKESPDSDSESSEAEGSSDGGSGHGAAVSTAAHCALHGSTHGALVSSIASRRGATVKQAKAACTATGGAVRTTAGKSAQAHAAIDAKSNAAHGKTGMTHEAKVHPTEE
jgi:hypothetical protein